MSFISAAFSVKMRLERSAELVGAKPLHLLTQTALPLKSSTGAFIAALRSANAELKIIFPLNMASNDDDRRQRRKQGGVVGAAASKTQVPPKARCGCWVPQPGRSGSHSKSFCLSNLHPICKLNLHLFCVLRRFSAILRGCKKLCGFCLTGGCPRVIMNT